MAFGRSDFAARRLVRHFPSSVSRDACQGQVLKDRGEGGVDMPILLILLIVLLLASLPTWPYSSGWGYYPASGLGTIFLIVLILVLLGRI
jgi:hypothetical protein